MTAYLFFSRGRTSVEEKVIVCMTYRGGQKETDTKLRNYTKSTKYRTWIEKQQAKTFSILFRECRTFVFPAAEGHVHIFGVLAESSAVCFQCFPLSSIKLCLIH